MTASDMALLPVLDALLHEVSVTEAARKVGLSTPAMSHALARVRLRFEDPLLVRSGRKMVLTPKAEALRPRIRELLTTARGVFVDENEPLNLSGMEKTFTIIVCDYVLDLLGPTFDRIARAEAPRSGFRFMPHTGQDPVALREGEIDLAIGLYGELPPEVRTRPLFTDQFVSVVRKGHPLAQSELTLEQFIGAEHLQVAPRGRPGGYLDDVLKERGVERQIVLAVPYVLAALSLVAETDYMLTVPERSARKFAAKFGLHLMAPPLALRPYAMSMTWHPRMDGAPAHAWLRETFLRAALEAAGDVHCEPRKRLASGGGPTKQLGRQSCFVPRKKLLHGNS